MSDDLSIPNQGYRSSRANRYGIGQGRLRQSMDPDTRRLVMFAGGLGAVLVVLIAASSLIGHRSTEVPVVVADTRPIRVKPENPGGMKIDGAENDVFSGGTDTASSKLSAAPENPDTKGLRTAETTPPPAISTPTPGSVAPSANRPVATATAPSAAKAPASLSKPLVSAATPAPQTLVLAPTAAARPSASATRPTPAKPPISSTEAHPLSAGHQATVQLAALSSEEAARSEWQVLSKRMPDLMNGRQPIYSRTERNGHTFWRVRTAGFADLTQARAFCEHVRTKGGGCSVADF